MRLSRHAVWTLPAFLSCAHAPLPAAANIAPAELYTSVTEAPPTELSTLFKQLVPDSDAVHDERLDRAASVLSEFHADGGGRVTLRYIEQLLWRMGVAASFNQVNGALFSGKGKRDLRLSMWLAQNVAQIATHHTGFGIMKGGGGTSPTTVNVVVTTNVVTVEPLRRRYAPGETITLMGTLRNRTDAHLSAFGPGSAELQDIPVVDGHFSVSWTAPQRPGQYVAELLGNVPKTVPLESGSSLLRLRFAVGLEEELDLEPDPEDPSSLATLAAAHINRAREKAGLPPLTLSVAPEALVAEAQVLLGQSMHVEPRSAEATPPLRLVFPGDRGQEWLMEELDRPSRFARFLRVQSGTLAVAAAKDSEGWSLVARVSDAVPVPAPSAL